MEAAEYAIVEAPQCEVRVASADELRNAGGRVFSPRRLLPDARPSQSEAKIRWVAGRSWPSGEPIWLPLEALTVGTDPTDLPRISQSSNGLASGNTRDEALFHAICELVERDATSIWSVLPEARRQATEFSPLSIDDAVAARMCAQVMGGGLGLRLFDQTTDLGVPCVMAVIWDPAASVDKRFDVAAGYGCHPVGTRAITRAISEAAQTRITNIAGGRDDFMPDEYVEAIDETVAFVTSWPVHGGRPPRWMPAGTPLPVLLDELAGRIGPSAELAYAELGGEDYGISVVRAISSVLEDRETNHYWRPGKRALKALMR
jgi:ribosomal protein S12 methylthiotransferase accessory factor